MKFPDVPSVGISGADKYVHALIHLIFTVFWTLHFRINNKIPALKAGLIVFAMSALFGTAIEIAQNYFTDTRIGDGNDIIANCAGSFIGLLLLAVLKLGSKRID